MNILITGGAGFIGSSLAKSLLKAKHDVSIIDHFSTFYNVERKKEQVNQIKRIGPVVVHEFDLLDEEETIVHFKNHKYDAVIHLAALPGVQPSLTNPHAYIDQDIKVTVNVLRASGISGVPHVLFGSSSSVYGNQDGPVSESFANGKVKSPYAAAKAGAESFCHAYQSLYGFKLTILRFFTVYGPWGRPDMAIPLFLTKLLNGESINIYGRHQSRDFTYIDDIVNGIALAFNQTGQSEIYNLGSGKPIRLEELIRLLMTYFPNASVVDETFRAGDVRHTWSNIEKAEKELGYVPEIGFEEGLRRTVEWAKKYHN
ncbi:NAD-dependent epimerase/dehydratase family protein [Pseudalkalibacillus hwajinpoensis]|uniref:NAD-dependent epimerase/dehydratase family protein n=1 Tax=Guptibacillus hwajinpoensis TaxID=208199 RepID=A0A4U1MH99_9BACL|nr:NAD-dependent epimerase/dehydratase family protein [Pseudalkalibacillus hwajinpoensis]TKD70353.1 NAD-dependent epimerase/dehydratase family protein [Pseudalkalibacillus hwajinpoensis]